MAKSRTSKRARLLPRLRVVYGEEIALGPGKADLLGFVHQTGSIRQAAERMNMSYMRAWKLIQTMNTSFREPLVLADRGGQARGGARLSPTGRQALALYRRMEKACREQNEKTWHQMLRLLHS